MTTRIISSMFLVQILSKITTPSKNWSPADKDAIAEWDTRGRESRNFVSTLCYNFTGRQRQSMGSTHQIKGGHEQSLLFKETKLTSL